MRSVKFPANFSCIALGWLIVLSWLQPVSISHADEQYDAEFKTQHEFLGQLKDAAAKDPTAAASEAKKFLQEHSQMRPEFLVYVYEAAFRIVYNQLKDAPGGAQLLDAGLQKFKNNEDRFILVGDKCNLLLDQKQPQAAQTLMESQWPQLLQADPAWQRYTLPPYVNALKSQGKNQEAISALRDAANATLYAQRNGGRRYEGLFDALIAELLLQGGEANAQEALSWAKVDFMTCDFTEPAINHATRLLTQVWSAPEYDLTALQAFSKAIEDPTKPNPLTAIKVPAVDLQKAQAQFDRLDDSQIHQRLTLLMLMGEWRDAMIRARRLLVDHPDSPQGIQEVCRVFKAADLNLQRANAFVEFYKNGKGVNPITEFFQQHPGAAATAAAAAKTGA